MDVQTQAITRPTWGNALAQPATEFGLTPLPLLSGHIPQGLRGTLYRNGPGRLQRGGQRVGHWFDGDGAVLAVHFTDNGATGTYRYVQTQAYQQEAAQNRFLFPNYGMSAPGLLWERWGKPVKNAANTSVLALPNKLLTLWEGGQPHALDLQTLETLGLDDLGQLQSDFAYSAHPKVDPATGDIFNFGVKAGLNAQLYLYRSDATGKILQHNQIPLKGVPLIHDFVMAGAYLIFFIPPVRLNLLPAALGLKSFSDALEWKPSLGTDILVIDRQTLTLVSRATTEAWFQWHFSNGFVEPQGTIAIDFVRYADFYSTNQYLKEVATGKTQTTAKGELWRVQLDPQTAKVKQIQLLIDQHCEFPLVPNQFVGEDSRYTYLSCYRPGQKLGEDLLGAIALYDHQQDTLTVADLGENRYPTEPIHVVDANNPEGGWILTVVYDGGTHESEVWIYQCDRLNEEPICKLGLPSVIPMGFHGTWKPA
ncbi:carotenoid oxygenase family protein [Oscillatoria amoena NRMC-F 0135]|nr:carotenoid oxygenase family protein [Geitlerinema splendidum]MDL5044704.1 carotenoid oxygenase family protein [Oscillatoria amoena NRMC-F 0135]